MRARRWFVQDQRRRGGVMERITQARVERRLAAILAADVAGYSRLMEQDEAGTLARLKLLRRELIDVKIAKHHGRIVKTTGDGLLIEFPSVVEAVACAVAVQREIEERDAAIPADRVIKLRIGINLGDVIVEGDDIFGDGVNIAARLEALAEPGGICVSRVVHDQVRDKLDLAFEDMGEQQVKNIARPVQVYRVRDASTAAKTSASPLLPLPDKPPATFGTPSTASCSCRAYVWRPATGHDPNPSARGDPCHRCSRLFAADGADEEGTLAALKAVRREMGDPKVKEHRGRIVKATGDGLLIEFSSVVDSVGCAVER
jgi:class 3 adenylate cyclase